MTILFSARICGLAHLPLLSVVASHDSLYIPWPSRARLRNLYNISTDLLFTHSRCFQSRLELVYIGSFVAENASHSMSLPPDRCQAIDVVGRLEGLSQPPREAVRLLLVVMSCHQVTSLLDSMLPTFTVRWPRTNITFSMYSVLQLARQQRTYYSCPRYLLPLLSIRIDRKTTANLSYCKGSPAIWSPPAHRRRLEPDKGEVFIDQNAARYSSFPLEPMFRAIYEVQPELNLEDVDVFICRNTMAKLFDSVTINIGLDVNTENAGE